MYKSLPDHTPAMLSIGRMASQAHVSANAVRFYERQGLLPAAKKSEAGYRLYGPEAVTRLRFIKQAQRCGFALAEIQELFAVQEADRACCGDVRSQVIAKKLQLHARIKEMQQMSAELDRLLAECGDSDAPVKGCTILVSLSKDAQ